MLRSASRSKQDRAVSVWVRRSFITWARSGASMVLVDTIMETGLTSSSSSITLGSNGLPLVMK